MRKIILTSSIAFLGVCVLFSIFSIVTNLDLVMVSLAIMFGVLGILFLREWKNYDKIPKPKIKKEKKEKLKESDDKVIWLDSLHEEPEPEYEVEQPRWEKLEEEVKIEAKENDAEKKDISGTRCWKCGLAKAKWGTTADKKDCQHEELNNAKITLDPSMEELISNLEECL